MIRLLHTTLLELREFEGDKVPSYAILSHTWEDEEVTFALFYDVQRRQQLRGWQKILKSCEAAALRDAEYIWIDTCCIDKSSSAELSEAINSMFRWYGDAKLCLTYLCDVDAVDGDDDSEWPSAPNFRQSRWFTRGWTLQELLAPREILFFDRSWHAFGTYGTLRAEIFAVMGTIPDVAMESISVARRMSWAANRNTTRAEDMAYCLLGIFDVNMPLLYGEGGEKAFLRLQLEIIRQSDDESIFAWNDPDSTEDTRSGLLARHPQAFAGSAGIFNLSAARVDGPGRPAYAMTKKGLQIAVDLEAIKVDELPRNNTFRFDLQCRRSGTRGKPAIALLRSSVDENLFCRLGPLRNATQSLPKRLPRPYQNITVRQKDGLYWDFSQVPSM